MIEYTLAEVYDPFNKGVPNPEVSETARALLTSLPPAPKATPATDDKTKAYVRGIATILAQGYRRAKYVHRSPRRVQLAASLVTN